MAFPSYIPTRVVSVGGSSGLESGRLLRTVVDVKASRSLIWDDTGARLEATGVAGVSSEGSEVTFELPRTDVQGWKDAKTGAMIDVSAPEAYSHRYVATVSFQDESGRKVGASYTLGPFVVTDGVGPIDLDKMVPASTVAGDAVSIPDRWAGLVGDALQAAVDSANAAEAAAAALLDSDAFVAGRLADPASETGAALSGILGSLPPSGLDDAGVAGKIADPASATAVAVAGVVEAALPSALSIVDHGSNPNFARPARLGPVLWRGSVMPVNRRAGDMVFAVAPEPVPWSPIVLDGLIGWWDPTLVAVADGAAVATFPDASGLGRPMNAWTTPRMTLDADGLGGLPALAVTTVGAALETATFAAESGPLTVMMNARIVTAGNSGYVLAGATTNTPNNFGIYRNGTPGSEGYGARRGSTTFSGTGGSDPNDHSFIVVMDGANSRLYVDGVQVAAGTLSTLSSDGLTKLGIGGRNSSGTIQTNPQVGTRIGDVAAVASAFDAATVAEATAWLKARRGV